MKLTFDIDMMFADTMFSRDGCEVDDLGQLFMLFLKAEGVKPEDNTYPSGKGWVVKTDTSRLLLLALMGDSIYDNSPHWTHLHHSESGLNVLWHRDVDISIIFDQEGENGFTIENRGSSLRRWESLLV